MVARNRPLKNTTMKWKSTATYIFMDWNFSPVQHEYSAPLSYDKFSKSFQNACTYIVVDANVSRSELFIDVCKGKREEKVSFSLKCFTKDFLK